MDVTIPKVKTFSDKDKIQYGFFIGYATISGEIAEHSLTQGSCYSTVLCETINENFDKPLMHLAKMVTKTQDNLIKKYSGKMAADHTNSLRWDCYFSDSKDTLENNHLSKIQRDFQSLSIAEYFFIVCEKS